MKGIVIFCLIVLPMTAQSENLSANLRSAEKYSRDARILAVKAFGLPGAKLNRFMIKEIGDYIDKEAEADNNMDCSSLSLEAERSLKSAVLKIINKNKNSPEQIKSMKKKDSEIKGMIGSIKNYTMYYCLFRSESNSNYKPW